MFFFAHPAYCPQCRAPRTSEPRCRQCGLLLVGAQADRLYALLAEADETLTTLRASSTAMGLHTAEGRVAASEPDPTAPAPLGPEPPPGPASPEYATGPPRPSRVTVGSVLLALGALLLVVAGTVFVAVAWGALSLAARTLLLLGVTGLVGAGAVVCLRRDLRASTETLWSVTVALLLVDLAAAYAAGLGGVGDLELRGLFTVAALLVGLTSVPVAMLARRRWGADAGRFLVAAEATVVGAAVLAAGAVASDWGQDYVWLPVALLGLLTVLAAGVRLAGLSAAAVGIGALAAVAYLVAAASAVAEVADRPRLEQLLGSADGSAWPALVLLVVSVAAAVAAGVSWQLQAAVTLVAVGLVAALVLLPAADAGRIPLALLGVALVVGLAAVGTVPAALPRTGAVLAARFSGVAGGLALGAGLLAPGVQGARALTDVAREAWAGDADVRLDGGLVQDPWLSLVLGAGLAVAALLARRWAWDDAPPLVAAEVLPGLASMCLLGGIVCFLLTVETPVFALCVLGVLGSAVATRVRRPALLLPALLLVVLGVTASAASAPLSAVTLLAAGAALVAAGALARTTPQAAPLVAVGAPIATLGVVATAYALGAEGDLAPLVVVVAAAVLAQAAGTTVGLLPALRTAWARPGEGAEVAAALALPATVALAAESATRVAVSLTALGVAAALTGVLRADRRPARWVGLVLLQLAWTVRLLDTDVEVVEVYTLPAGLVLVGAGLWAMRGDHGLRTWAALLPGLSLAVLPSLPQAVADPTSVRAWLVGAAGLGLVAGAIRLRWAAPLAVGSVAVALLALAHLVSVAAAAPRWTVIATVGAALVGAGITWESRVRDARALAAYVRDLR